MQKVSSELPRFKIQLILLVVLLTSLTRGVCQNAMYRVDGNTALSYDSTYVVEPGVYPAKVIPLEKQYQYPQFLAGQIILSTGKKWDVDLLNYNLLYDAIQFINNKGDTVWLDNTIVEYIQIDSDFYFSDLKERYFRLLSIEHPLKLMVKSKWLVARKYPLQPHWNSIESPQKPMRAADFYFPMEYSVFVKVQYFCFLGPENKLYKTEKHSLAKAFPEKKKVIRKYLKQHKINYSSESDLRELVTFCNALTSVQAYK